MRELHLHSFSDTDTFQVLKQSEQRKSLRVEPSSCYWVGSASLSDLVGVEKLLRAAKQDEIELMVQHTAIAGNVAYALLVRDTGDEHQFHVIVLEVKEGVEERPKILLIKKVSFKLSVVPKPATKLATGLAPDVKKEFWKTFFGQLFSK